MFGQSQGRSRPLWITLASKQPPPEPGGQPGAGGPPPAAKAPGAGGAASPAPVSSGAMQPWWEAWSVSWGEASAKVAAQAKSIRPPDMSKGLGVRMDVDVLNPMISAVKTNWQQLPEPVKQVAPFLGTGVLAGVLVGGLYREQLRLADARYERLKREHSDLSSKMQELERQVGGRTAAVREAQLADALSHVTQAAAAAATAASTAASACALPAYDPAKTFSLLQQLSPTLPLVGAYGGAGYGGGYYGARGVPYHGGGGGRGYGLSDGSEPGRRSGRRGGRGEPRGAPPRPPRFALPWARGGGPGAEAARRRGGRYAGGYGSGSSSDWSDTSAANFSATSEEEEDVPAPRQDGSSGARGSRAARRGGRGGPGAGGERRRERPAAAPPGAEGPLAAAAAAARQLPASVARLPAALAQAPGWVGEQASRARAGFDRMLRASRGGGRGDATD